MTKSLRCSGGPTDDRCGFEGTNVIIGIDKGDGFEYRGPSAFCDFHFEVLVSQLKELEL